MSAGRAPCDHQRQPRRLIIGECPENIVYYHIILEKRMNCQPSSFYTSSPQLLWFSAPRRSIHNHAMLLTLMNSTLLKAYDSSCNLTISAVICIIDHPQCHAKLWPDPTIFLTEMGMFQVSFFYIGCGSSRESWFCPCSNKIWDIRR